MIYINAPIGVGKSTLTKYLSESLGTHAFYESVEDMPMLKEFYSNGDKSRSNLSFELQIAFLNYRFSQLRQGLYLQEHDGEVNTVYDSSLLSDGIMCNNLYKRGEMSGVLYDLYQELSANMVADVAGHPFNGTPDLIVYLQAPFEVMLDHIKKRGREMETQDPALVDYYKSVWDAYNDWYRGYSASPVVTIDMGKYDFVADPDDREKVLSIIKDRLVSLGKLKKASMPT